MITRIIQWSVFNRPLILIFTVVLAIAGIRAIMHAPLDAIPDLSDIQVIIKTPFPGQSPEVVEDQVTYPISTVMLSVPKTVAVRGFSYFGDSYVYIIFEEGTDMYWARARVLEYLNQARNQLPSSVIPQLGPDATGVGWVYQYALVDRTGKHDLADLRSLQDWYIKFDLRTVPGVAEVASVGGMVKQYQVVLDPDRMRAFAVTIDQVKSAIRSANQETGGSVIELGEAEHMIRGKGYLKSIEDINLVPLGLGGNGVPVLLQDVAQIRMGPQMRRGIAELNGEGEVVGGIVVMRWGENALEVIRAVKERVEKIRANLPKGVELLDMYDRSSLIHRAVDNLLEKIIEEFAIVAVVCFIFLFHLRSALVAIVLLPLGISTAFIIMNAQGINANIMSLGGIAIAIGAMIDAAIVMVENAHKHMEKQKVTAANRWSIITQSAAEVGPALFFSLLIITLSFIPVFALEHQEGKLFSPLAFTKTYSMAAAAALSITLMPVLMGLFIRGRIPSEHSNPINRFLIALYMPVIYFVLRLPYVTIALCAATVFTVYYPLQRLGGEFMPELDEGDLLYMPTTFPGVSIGKAGEILQQTDRMIRLVPEVRTVFGKVGRAETATDSASLAMLETTIQLKPRNDWRPGMTPKKIIEELEQSVKFPGLTNAWVQPIKTRIDMITTGVKSTIGLKIYGQDLNVVQSIGQDMEKAIKSVKGTSVFSERTAGGRYLNVEINRRLAARYGLNIADIHDVISNAVGGTDVTFTVEGLERYPVNIRYPAKDRDSISKLNLLPIITKDHAHIPLGEVAVITSVDGPDMIKTENARRTGWIFVEIAKDRDLSSYMRDIDMAIKNQVKIPSGYNYDYVGQYVYMQRFWEKMRFLLPLTLLIIFLLLYFNFRSFVASTIVFVSIWFAAVGAFWLVYLLGYNLSAAVWVGIIALLGVSAEFGVVMMVYLDHAVKERKPSNLHELRQAVIEGAVLRVRPKAMTAAVIIAGLLPIMFGQGSGSEVMKRIGAPMLGGMITAPMVSMVLIPAFYIIWRGRRLRVRDQLHNFQSRFKKVA